MSLFGVVHCLLLSVGLIAPLCRVNKVVCGSINKKVNNQGEWLVRPPENKGTSKQKTTIKTTKNKFKEEEVCVCVRVSVLVSTKTVPTADVKSRQRPPLCLCLCAAPLSGHAPKTVRN